MKALLLVVLLLIPAHHEYGHRVLIMGEATRVPVKFAACDTEDQATEIFVTRRDVSVDAGLLVYQKYATQINSFGQPICGMTVAYIAITRIILTTQYITHTEILAEADVLQMTSRGPMQGHTFIILQNVKILPADVDEQDKYKSSGGMTS